MEKISVSHCLLCLTLFVSTASTVVFTSVPARLNASVTLPCDHKCSSSAKWIRTHEPQDVLAQCDQTSCQTKKDFQMSYINYLNGNLGLTIAKVDYSKRTFYTCTCGDADVCNVRLSIVALKSTILKKAGEPLFLKSHVAEPVEVVFKNSNSSDLYGIPICTVVRRSLQCHTNYTRRATANQTDLTLKSLQESDSGVYTVRDMKNDEDIHIYTVAVEDTIYKEEELGQFVVITLITLLVLGTLSCIIILIIRERKQREKIQQLQNSLKKEKAENQKISRSDTDLTELCRRMAHVDEFIQQSEDTSSRVSKSWTISGMNNTEEEMRNIRAKMEELFQPKNKKRFDLLDHNQWWSQKRTKLDQILEQWKNERAELDEFRRQLQNNRTNGLMGSSDVPTIFFKRGLSIASSINGLQKTLQIPNGVQPWRNERAEPEEIKELNEGYADEQTLEELSEESEEVQSITDSPSEPETQN